MAFMDDELNKRQLKNPKNMTAAQARKEAEELRKSTYQYNVKLPDGTTSTRVKPLAGEMSPIMRSNLQNQYPNLYKPNQPATAPMRTELPEVSKAQQIGAMSMMSSKIRDLQKPVKELEKQIEINRQKGLPNLVAKQEQDLRALKSRTDEQIKSLRSTQVQTPVSGYDSLRPDSLVPQQTDPYAPSIPITQPTGTNIPPTDIQPTDSAYNTAMDLSSYQTMGQKRALETEFEDMPGVQRAFEEYAYSSLTMGAYKSQYQPQNTMEQAASMVGSLAGMIPYYTIANPVSRNIAGAVIKRIVGKSASALAVQGVANADKISNALLSALDKSIQMGVRGGGRSLVSGIVQGKPAGQVAKDTAINTLAWSFVGGLVPLTSTAMQTAFPKLWESVARVSSAGGVAGSTFYGKARLEGKDHEQAKREAIEMGITFAVMEGLAIAGQKLGKNIATSTAKKKLTKDGWTEYKYKGQTTGIWTKQERTQFVDPENNVMEYTTQTNVTGFKDEFLKFINDPANYAKEVRDFAPQQAMQIYQSSPDVAINTFIERLAQNAGSTAVSGLPNQNITNTISTTNVPVDVMPQPTPVVSASPVPSPASAVPAEPIPPVTEPVAESQPIPPEPAQSVEIDNYIANTKASYTEIQGRKVDIRRNFIRSLTEGIRENNAKMVEDTLSVYKPNSPEWKLYNDITGNNVKSMKGLQKVLGTIPTAPPITPAPIETPPQGAVSVPETDALSRIKPEDRITSYQDLKNKLSTVVNEEESAAVSAIIEGAAAYENLSPDEYVAKRYAGFETTNRGGTKTLAQTMFLEDGRAILKAFKSNDVVSTVHEVAHVFRRGLDESDMKVAEDWAGVKDGNWTRKAEEKFAEGFEVYLKEGKAPNEGLRGVFEKFKKWITEVYKNLRRRKEVKLSDDIRRVFDRVVSGRKVEVAGKTPVTPKPSKGAVSVGSTPKVTIAEKAKAEVSPELESARVSLAKEYGFKTVDEAIEKLEGEKLLEFKSGIQVLYSTIGTPAQKAEKHKMIKEIIKITQNKEVSTETQEAFAVLLEDIYAVPNATKLNKLQKIKDTFTNNPDDVVLAQETIDKFDNLFKKPLYEMDIADVERLEQAVKHYEHLEKMKGKVRIGNEIVEMDNFLTEIKQRVPMTKKALAVQAEMRENPGIDAAEVMNDTNRVIKYFKRIAGSDLDTPMQMMTKLQDGGEVKVEPGRNPLVDDGPLTRLQSAVYRGIDKEAEFKTTLNKEIQSDIASDKELKDMIRLSTLGSKTKNPFKDRNKAFIETKLPDFTDENGKVYSNRKARLTHGQRIHIYNSLDNEKSLSHVLSGLRTEGKYFAGYVRTFTPEDIKAFKASMSPKEIKLAGMVRKWHDMIYDQVNPVFERMNGYPLQKEKYYNPILLSAIDRASKMGADVMDGRTWSQNLLTSMAFLQERTGDKSPALIGDAFELLDRAKNGAGAYVGYAEPLMNLDKVVKTKAFKTFLTVAGFDEEASVLAGYSKGVQGIRAPEQDALTQAADSLLSHMKGVVLWARLSTPIIQFTAAPALAKYVPAKYIMRNIGKVATIKEMEDMGAYYMVQRSQGHSSKEMSEVSTEYSLRSTYGLGETIRQVGFHAPTIADNILLGNAAKVFHDWIKSENPTFTKDQVNELTRDALTTFAMETQSHGVRVAQAKVFRSPSSLAKHLMVFKQAPTLFLNMEKETAWRIGRIVRKGREGTLTSKEYKSEMLKIIKGSFAVVGIMTLQALHRKAMRALREGKNWKSITDIDGWDIFKEQADFVPILGDAADAIMNNVERGTTFGTWDLSNPASDAYLDILVAASNLAIMTKEWESDATYTRDGDDYQKGDEKWRVLWERNKMKYLELLFNAGGISLMNPLQSLEMIKNTPKLFKEELLKGEE